MSCVAVSASEVLGRQLNVFLTSHLGFLAYVILPCLTDQVLLKTFTLWLTSMFPLLENIPLLHPLPQVSWIWNLFLLLLFALISPKLWEQL